MTALPKKRERPKSGILRAPRREWPRHRRFVRSHACVVTLGKSDDHCDGPIQCCHFRTSANAGKGLKPADWDSFPGCFRHHAEQHAIGQPAFERKYGLDLAAICAELARQSPDAAMREAMREAAP